MYYYSSLILNRLHTLGNCSALTYANKPHLVLNLVLLKSSLSLNYRKFLVDYSNFYEKKNFASILVDFRWTDFKLVRCRLILLRIKKNEMLTESSKISILHTFPVDIIICHDYVTNLLRNYVKHLPYR